VQIVVDDSMVNKQFDILGSIPNASGPIAALFSVARRVSPMCFHFGA
jgi:hypothetical protein